MEIEIIELITENAPQSVPYLLLIMWTRLEMSMRGQRKLTKRVSNLERCMQDIKEKVSAVRKKISEAII